MFSSQYHWQKLELRHLKKLYIYTVVCIYIFCIINQTWKHFEKRMFILFWKFASKEKLLPE